MRWITAERVLGLPAFLHWRNRKKSSASGSTPTGALGSERRGGGPSPLLLPLLLSSPPPGAASRRSARLAGRCAGGACTGASTCIGSPARSGAVASPALTARPAECVAAPGVCVGAWAACAAAGGVALGCLVGLGWGWGASSRCWGSTCISSTGAGSNTSVD